MADRNQVEKCGFELPLLLEPNAATEQGLKDIAKDLKDDLHLVHNHLASVGDLGFVHIEDVKFVNGVILLKYVTKDEEELLEFFECTKEPDNKLSRSLTSYFDEQSLQFQGGLQISARIQCTVHMTKKDCLTCQLKYFSDDSSNRCSDESTQSITKESTTEPQPQGNMEESKTTTSHIAKDGSSGAECLTKGNETANTETPYVAKTFLLYMSHEQRQNVKHINIGSKQCRVLNHEMKPHGKYLFEFKVHIPVEEVEACQYKYIVTWKATFFSRQSVEESKECFLNEHTFQRDIWSSSKKKYDDIGRGVNIHLLDILFHEECNVDLYDSCQQIENICKVKLPNNKALSVIRNLNHNLYETDPPESTLLFLIVAGKILNSPEQIFSERLLDVKSARKMISATQVFRLNQIPASCYTSTQLLYMHVCRIVAKEKYLITYIDEGYMIFDDCFIQDQILERIKSNIPISNDSDDSLSTIQSLCTKLYDKAVSNNSSVPGQIIETLIRNLPFRVSLTAFCTLRKQDLGLAENESSLQNRIYGSMTVRTEAFLTDMKKTKNIIGLINGWRDMNKGEIDVRKLKPKFEDALLFILDSRSISSTDIPKFISSCVEELGLFCGEQNKKQLLEIITRSQNREVLEAFFLLSNSSKTADVYNYLDRNNITSLCHNLVTCGARFCNSRDEEIRYVCSCLSRIWNIPQIKSRSEYEDILKNFVFKEFEKCRPEELLAKTEFIEMMSADNDHIENVYKEYFDVLMKDESKDDRSPEKILGWFSNKTGAIRIDSRLTAELVCILLEKHGCLTGTSVSENFINLVSQHRFWLTVMNMKGRSIDLVKENHVLCNVLECITEMVNLFRTHRVKCDFVESIEKRQKYADAAKMILAQKCKTNEIEKLWTDSLLRFREVKDELNMVYSVLSEVRNIIKDGPPNLKELIDHVKCAEVALISGKFDTKDCISNNLIWKGIERLPEVCSYLQPLILSEVFWNVCLNNVKDEFELAAQKATIADDPIESLTSLFQEVKISETPPYVDEDECFSQCILFMQILKRTGCQMYSNIWKCLLNDEGFLIGNLQNMFGASPDIKRELEIAEKTLHIVIDDSDEKTLKRIFSIDKVEETVFAIRVVATVFAIDHTNDPKFTLAIDSFQELMAGTAVAYTFKDVKSTLNTVYSLTDNLSEETVHIMKSLGNSSTLIEFLKSIVEEDIKNLIDAVEDISEQQVRESTVSALIEVKQFLHPFLILQGSRDCTTFLQALEKQTLAFKKNAVLLPQKLEDCVLNLHNLKSLYNGVANRGEQTKEIIKNIMRQGSFLFTLSKMCTSVTFEVAYKKNRNKETHQKSTLIDLRSRALLLMNTERKTQGDARFKREDLQSFIGFIDNCLDISDHLFLLHTSGHIKYMVIREQAKQTDLESKKETLASTFFSWDCDLKDERYGHYLMNFIHGNHLQLLYKYLEYDDVEERAVQTILSLIHPNMEPNVVRKMYQEEKTKTSYWTNRRMLHCIGHALHFSLKGLNVFRRPITEQTNTKLSNIVQPGKLAVVQLEEDSLHTAKTLLALYMCTTQMLPEPNHVLFCNRETSLMELKLLIQRAMGANKFYREKTLFCIANVEMLPNEVQFSLVEILRHLDRETKFLLSIICRGSRYHPFIDELSDCVMSVTPATDRSVRDIFKEHCKNIVTVSSNVAGTGKTSYIKRAAHKCRKGISTLHISGSIRKSHLVERINGLQVKAIHVLHIDVGNVDDPSELDTILFELIVLRFVSAGRMSVSLQVSNVYVEIANTINDALRNSLQTAVLFQRVSIDWKGIDSLVISKEIDSPVQIVCHYLEALDKQMLDEKDIFVKGDILRPLPSSKCKTLLRTYIPGKVDSSYPLLSSFINVLADQLKKMSHSSFFKVSYLRDMVGRNVHLAVKSQLVRAMIDACSDFATRSVNVSREGQISTVTIDLHGNDKVSQTDNSEAKFAAYVTSCVDGMIRWEDSNHLMYVFHNQNIHTLSVMYRHLKKVPTEIRKLFEGQMKKPMEDFRHMSQLQLQAILQKVARINPLPLSIDILTYLSNTYALTADNLLKMIIIMLRIKANIPVVVMGETGCGKTSLVRYLASICEVNFDVMNIHAGIQEEDIVERVLQNNSRALKDIDSDIWLFLDEINTSDSIGVISDVICHHRCLEIELSPNLVIIGACNPYKLRTKQAICTAGLEGKAKTDELSRLVYRVQPLPEMMIDYVWDFGSLNEIDEKEYIHRMIGDIFPAGCSKYQELFTTLLSASQAFVRNIENSAYSVSLRDVQRCKILTKWFLTYLPEKKPLANTKLLSCDITLKSIILALAHCYQSRFHDKCLRKHYRSMIGDAFRSHGHTFESDHGTFIQAVIREEQNDILRRMKLPAGTACNTALQENVFIILVCIFNRIPIFVVGKPGCSKSLAMQLIKSNLRGKDSEDEFFRKLPQLYCVSFQGSESSTSDGIIKVFAKAKKYQESNSKDEVLSVVILDEIGLAEISRFNPLKVLHNLLEPDGKSQPEVAVVGISNWALDASKMNRAIHLSRPDMDEEELFDTAVSISESFLGKVKKSTLFKSSEKTNCSVTTSDIHGELQGMAKAYFQYINLLRFKHFHGLRDYYSLIKFVSRMFAERGRNTSDKDKADMISNGIARNFGGLPDKMQTLHAEFRGHIPFDSLREKPVMELITENIQDSIARHLMIITTGESVLGIVEQKLKTLGYNGKEVIFGSQFEEDLTEDYNYRILSRIILCMEEGVVLILKDLESIYGSLYDMLNQNYTIIGKKKNCRVALGPYSNPICHVADSFRCIVLTDESKLDLTDPPFLNRFEKQYLTFFDTVQKKHIGVINRLEEWIDELTNTGSSKITKEEVLAIYNKDLTASLVLKIESDFVPTWNTTEMNEEVFDKCKQLLLKLIKPEIIIRQKMSEGPKKRCLSDEMFRKYFSLPIHEGLEHFISKQTVEASEEERESGILSVVFTNSNIHTKITKSVCQVPMQIEKLGTFKSEKQLSSRINHFWNESECKLLLVQCNAYDDEKHIFLTKLVIERHRNEFNKKKEKKPKHVYFVIHMNRCKTSTHSVCQLNFLSEWKLVLIDSIQRPTTPLSKLQKMTLLEAILQKKSLKPYLREELYWAFSRIRYGYLGRDVASISEAISNIEKSEDLLDILENEILSHIKRHNSVKHEKQWQLQVASDYTALASSCSFIEALEHFIIDVIKTPLAKLIYRFEGTGILESFYKCQEKNEINKDKVLKGKRNAWLSGIHHNRSFSIDDVPDESGPECYTCDTIDYALNMPFSLYIYENIEATKGDFMDTVHTYRRQCLLDEEEDLPPDVYNEILSQQENFILEKIPDLNGFLYDTWDKDYLNDFSIITEQKIFVKSMHMDRANMLKLIIERLGIPLNVDPFRFVLRLHTMVWVHFELIRSELLLIDKCISIIPESITDIMDISSYKIQIEDNISDDEDGPVSETKEKFDLHRDTQLTNDEIVLECQTLEEKIDVNDDGTEIQTENQSDDEERPVSETKEEFDLHRDTQLTNDEIVLECQNLEEKIVNDDGTEIQMENQYSRIEGDDSVATICRENIEEVHFVDTTMVISDNTLIGAPEIEHSKGPYIEEKGSNSYLKTSDRLVHTVCKHLLPTSHCLQKHKGIHHWLDDVNSTLSIATKVSRSPDLLYSLRVCVEVAENIILPFSLNGSLLENLGNVMALGVMLDSDQVFRALTKVIESAFSVKATTDDDINMVCHRLLSSYFVRCLSADPDTSSYAFLLDLVKEGKIPEEAMILYKVPVSLFLQNVEEDLFNDMLKNETKGEMKEYITKFDEDGCGGHMLNELNHVLVHMFEDKGQPISFITMLTDILQDNYANEFLDLSSYLDGTNEGIGFPMEQQTITLFYACTKTLEGHFDGLKYVASIAFCKCFLQRATILILSSNQDVFSRVLSILDVALTVMDSNEPSSLTLFFLKEILSTKSIIQLQRFCTTHGKNYTFLKGLSWEERNSYRTFDKSPLCLFIEQTYHKDGCICCKSMQVVDVIQKLKTLVQTAASGTPGMFQLLSFVLSHFYLQQTDSDLDDTDRTVAGLLLNEIIEEKFSSALQMYVKCLLGERNFHVTRFTLTDATQQEQVCQISVLISLYGLVLGHMEFFSEGDKPLPVLFNCLTVSTKIQTQFLPGCKDIDEDRAKLVTEPLSSHYSTYIGNCKCGYRIAYTRLQRSYECVICSKLVPVTEMDLQRNIFSNIGHVEKHGSSSFCNTRLLNPVATHLIQFMIKGCFLGSIALGFSSETTVAETLLNHDNDAEEFLIDEIDIHWNALKMLLNLDDNSLRSLINAIFIRTERQLCSNSCETLQDKVRWENEFEQVVTEVTDKRFKHIKETVLQHYRLHYYDSEAINQRLLEIDDDSFMKSKNNAVCKPALYRVRSNPSKTSFSLELYFHRKNFPLLELVLNNEEILRLPIHILKIIQWHSAAVANASYMLKRHECMKMTVQDFLYYKHESMKKDVMKTRFGLFKKSWDVLRTSLKDFKVAEYMKRIHSESNMSECLILGEESVPFKVLSTLVGIQNELLNKVLILAKQCKGLMILEKDGASVIPCVKAIDLKEEDLLNCDIDWNTLLMQESQCDLNYGSGRYIHYDLHSIEETVARKVFSGKPYITHKDSLPEIIFIDELHKNYASLIKELRINITQEPLPLDISTGINIRKWEDPRMSTELLTHLGIVMTVLKKTKGAKDQPLVEYVDKWQSVMCRNFPKHLLPNPRDSVKLCHVVALSELLEEISADYVKEGLGDEYREQLDRPLRDHIILQLNNDNLSFNAFKALKRFVYRCLASRFADPKQSIRVYLSDESFWPMNMFQTDALLIDGKKIMLNDLLPNGLMVCHIYACYSLMEAEIERRRQGNLKLNEFVTSFNARKKSSSETRTAQKKKKMVAARMF